MAGKSLLHQFGWHTGKYEIAKKAEISKLKLTTMEGSFRRQGSSDREPPTKKRRTEDEEDPWGDDLTQADLHDIEDLEFQASQAVTQRPEQIGPGTAGGTSHDLVHPSETFRKPLLSRSSSSSSAGTRGGNRSHSSGSSHSAQNSLNQSHSSSNSTSLSHSSHSSYPSSLSHYSSNSSASVKSGSSVENIHVPSGSLTRLSTSSLDMSTAGLPSESQSSMSEMARMKSELAALKLQLESMKQEVCEKEGENQLLRNNLNKRDAELDSMKTEKITQIYQQNLQQSAKEKQLQDELSKLQTQLQFKEQEERELKSRCRDLDIQLKSALAGGPSSSQVVPQPSGSVSPKPRKVPVEEKSPKGPGGFPSKRSFMAHEGSPQKVKVKVTELGDHAREAEEDSGTRPCLQLAHGRRKCNFKLSARRSPRDGSQLMSRLLSLPPCMTGTIGDRGIVGLLNTPSTSPSLYNVQFDRDRDTSLLSPVKSRRISDLHSLVTQIDKPEMLSLVPVEHFNMAVQGLKNLLVSESQSDEKFSSHVTSGFSSDHMALNGHTQESSESSKVLSENQSNLDSAILILPLIYDYLRHYVQMLETTIETSGSSATSLSSPESFDTSSESPTGSLSLFLKTTANFANDLESLAVASLNTLLVLVSCDSVRRILLEQEYPQLTQVTQQGAQPVEAESCSSSDDLPQSSTSVRQSSYIPRKYIVRMNLLHKVLKLANPGTKGFCNSGIVTACLNILTVLASSCNEQHIPGLLPVLQDEGLQNCLDHEGDVAIVTHGLQLFKALVRSNQIVSSLCSNTTGCVLMTVYSLCTTDRWSSEDVGSQLRIASLILESILYLASSHKGCLTLILESDCQCSAEIVKSIVTLLHSVLKIYKSEQQDPVQKTDFTKFEDSQLKQEVVQRETSQRILQTGLQLLHLMSQFDAGFVNRHIPVQHKYVQLICGLTHIFRHIENNDSEMNAIQDLWDFNQDDSELSQDSDYEDQEAMDT